MISEIKYLERLKIEFFEISKYYLSISIKNRLKELNKKIVEGKIPVEMSVESVMEVARFEKIVEDDPKMTAVKCVDCGSIFKKKNGKYKITKVTSL